MFWTIFFAVVLGIFFVLFIISLPKILERHKENRNLDKLYRSRQEKDKISDEEFREKNKEFLKNNLPESHQRFLNWDEAVMTLSSVGTKTEVFRNIEKELSDFESILRDKTIQEILDMKDKFYYIDQSLFTEEFLGDLMKS